jgi:hypothetical protein
VVVLRLEIELVDPASGDALPRLLLADTGGGDAAATFELILHEDDCQRCASYVLSGVTLTGAYSGHFAVYSIRVRIPTIGFDEQVEAAGIPDSSNSFDGIACFRFLNRFTYGNFGDRTAFGLEV